MIAKGEVRRAVRELLVVAPGMKLGLVRSKLAKFNSKSVNGAFYAVRAELELGKSKRGVVDTPIAPSQALRARLTNIALKVGDVPLEVEIVNGKPIGKLLIAKTGIEFRLAKSKSSAKPIKFETLAKLAGMFE
jgi:hypothetical protein